MVKSQRVKYELQNAKISKRNSGNKPLFCKQFYFEIEFWVWLPFFPHFDFFRKMNNFRPFFPKNEKK